jgi:tetratricopeptide (TPR) repeat protein
MIVSGHGRRAVDSEEPVGPAGARVAWPVRSGTVPSPAGGFRARAETAADLGAALVAGAVVVLVPVRVAGEKPGGWLDSCGKTQLAAQVAEALWRSRRVELLVWVAATSRASVLSGYAEAAVHAIGADPGGDGESAAARLVGWLSETSRPWLVVLDDLRDMADLEGLWPAGPAGRVLITTANPAAFSGEQGALMHPVGVFSPQEALSYLLGRLAAEPGQQPGAQGLAADLGYEPLALAQASAVIASSALSCSDYSDYFARTREKVAAAAGRSPPAAAVTFAISVEHADQLSPGGAARALLALAALLDGHGIPGAVFATPAASEYLAEGDGGDPAEREPDREALPGAERAGLLSVDPSGTTVDLAGTTVDLAGTTVDLAGTTVDLAGTTVLVRMNAVVQAAVRAATPAGPLHRAAAAAADALLQAWPGDERPAWLAGALRSCTVSLQQATGDLLWAAGCHPLLLRAGRSLDRACLTGPAVGYWSELAALSDRILGRGHPDTLAIGELLGGAYLAAGRASEAVSWFRWVLAERVRVLGPDHPRAIAARRDLGHALVAADQASDAVTVLDRVVGDYERVRGADQLDTLSARDELAAAYHAARQFAEAIRIYRHTLASRERIQGPEHPDTMTTRQKLAGEYLADGKPKAALSHYKRALADRERVLGPDHLDTIAVRGALGSAYQSAGRMASALRLQEQTRAGYERALGVGHPDALASSASLAHAYYAVGRVTDAMILFRDTLMHCEQALPPGDPLTRAVRQSLANIAGA